MTSRMTGDMTDHVSKRMNMSILSDVMLAGKEFVRFHKNRALLAKFLIFCIVLGMIIRI